MVAPVSNTTNNTTNNTTTPTEAAADRDWFCASPDAILANAWRGANATQGLDDGLSALAPVGTTARRTRSTAPLASGLIVEHDARLRHYTLDAIATALIAEHDGVPAHEVRPIGGRWKIKPQVVESAPVVVASGYVDTGATVVPVVDLVTLEPRGVVDLEREGWPVPTAGDDVTDLTRSRKVQHRGRTTAVKPGTVRPRQSEAPRVDGRRTQLPSWSDHADGTVVVFGHGKWQERPETVAEKRRSVAARNRSAREVARQAAADRTATLATAPVIAAQTVRALQHGESATVAIPGTATVRVARRRGDTVRITVTGPDRERIVRDATLNTTVERVAMLLA